MVGGFDFASEAGEPSDEGAGVSLRDEGDTAHPETSAMPARITASRPPIVGASLTAAIPLHTTARERGRARA
jgi:hypothetical protein